MCGIFLLHSKSGEFSTEMVEQVKKNFNLLAPRGPDDSKIIKNKNNIIGFHRLAINDTTSNGMQPFEISNNFYTMCNGEIYNYKELQEIYKFPLKSNSDCEIIPYLFEEIGLDKTVNLLDGIFAICKITPTSITLVRDKIGVKPLFYAKSSNFFGVSSLAKSLENLGFKEIEEVQPSSIITYHLNVSNISAVISRTYWKKKYLKSFENHLKPRNEYINTLRNLLIKSVQKRMTTDRNIGCLLSGGLDSSIIASILSIEMKKIGKELHTFSVGFPGSSDIFHAKKVSEHIGSVHHELYLEYETALERIPDIAYALETYDVTTIRASTPMFLLCEWINKNFPEKVIFSGEGSDELFCGYLYFHLAPNSYEAAKDSIRLVNELYKYDVLRADRCTSGNGLEFREPFLDSKVVDFALNLSGDIKRPGKIEKELLREAFSEYLPQEIVWRKKAAFSDAVSNLDDGKLWYQYIQEWVREKYDMNEAEFYKYLFAKNFSSYKPDTNLWLPKWINTNNEPSATVLTKNLNRVQERITKNC